MCGLSRTRRGLRTWYVLSNGAVMTGAADHSRSPSRRSPRALPGRSAAWSTCEQALRRSACRSAAAYASGNASARRGESRDERGNPVQRVFRGEFLPARSGCLGSPWRFEPCDICRDEWAATRRASVRTASGSGFPARSVGGRGPTRRATGVTRGHLHSEVLDMFAPRSVAKPALPTSEAGWFEGQLR